MAATELTRLQRLTFRVWLAVGVVLLTVAALWLLARPLAVIVPPILVAMILIYVLNPLVTLLARWRVPRLVGSLLSLLLFAVVLVGVGALLTPALVEQVTTFAEVAPELGREFTERVDAWLVGVGFNVDLGGEFDPEAAADQVQGFLADADARSGLAAFISGLGGLFTGVVNFVIAIVVGPFVAAYALWDLPRIGRWARQAVPPANREEVLLVAHRLSQVVGGFIRGQLIIAAYVGVATSIGLAIIGLPFWLVLGIVAGITNLVPLIGPFVAGLLGVLVALFTDGVGLAVAVVIVMTIVQQGDNQIISPLVMGRTVRLHPLVVLLALLVAGTLYGLFGLLIAVPVVAAANVLLGHAWRTRVPWASEGGEAEEAAARAGPLAPPEEVDTAEVSLEGRPATEAMEASEPQSPPSPSSP